MKDTFDRDDPSAPTTQQVSAKGAGPRNRLRSGALVVTCAGAITLLIWERTMHLTPESPWWSFPADHHIYLFMASHRLGSFHVAPWCWRILVPAIAGQFPSPLVGFQVVTFVSLWSTGVLTYVITRRAGFSVAMATVGMLVFYGLSFAVKFNMWDFWLSDPLAFFFVALALFFVLDECDWLVAATLAIGVMAKESAILVVALLYGLRAASAWDRRIATRAAIVGLPALLVLLLVRWAIPAWNSHPDYIATLARPIRWNAHNLPSYAPWFVLRQTVAARWREPVDWVVRTASAFGLIPVVLACFGGKRNVRLLVRSAPFLILVLSQELFALNTQRLLVLAFPVLILLAVGGAQQLRERGVPTWVLLALAGADASLQLFTTAGGGPGVLPQLGALALGAAAVLATTWNRMGGPRGLLGTGPVSG